MCRNKYNYKDIVSLMWTFFPLQSFCYFGLVCVTQAAEFVKLRRSSGCLEMNVVMWRYARGDCVDITD